ncbi:MAG: hypothetical protein OXG92_04230 [Chloroflexi bacterium]|nr:hypothetical protein [Chloroflexota bacterium]MCY3715665.1 hypothetical protein [Chloroflexota bacterium]MDE2650597.1 hypothetical protein [Chloroflexota bacterium]MXV94015.1 hypothetical protein [Chloroflexota bacterium]MXX82016.1 hypothetical protein [Chloroflexota bacterium]
MKNLLATLHSYDPGMLPALADVWGVDAKRFNDDELIAALHTQMQAEAVVQVVWDKLDERSQGALRALASSAQGRMTSSLFAHTGNGKIRKLGRAQIARLQPHIKAENIAETLYYRGLIGEAHAKTADSIVSFVYVPGDLVARLPLQQTSYGSLDASYPAHAADTQALEIIESLPADAYQRADTTLVDDMTSLLAVLQAGKVALAGAQLPPESLAQIRPLLLNELPSRLTFLLGIGSSAKLMAIEEGKALPRRQEARDWLAATRAAQVRALADAWRRSQNWRDMWQIEGLLPEESGWAYDAAVARNALLNLLADLLPAAGWVSLSELIEIIKATQPDFQRPDGDYESWYIRNDEGEFLRGFESWDAVEGALIEYLATGPMHWLGLVDVGEDMLRLTAYGNAFFGKGDWPRMPEQPTPFNARDDGALLVSRRVNRFERFQLARFARCALAGDPYIYTMDGESIDRAEAQGISRQQVHSFISKQLAGNPLPLPILKLLREWGTGARTRVSLEAQVILRTTSEEEMDKIFAFPAYRRYLGARLGAMACVVRADQWQQLEARLGADDIDVDASRLEGGQD